MEQPRGAARSRAASPSSSVVEDQQRALRQIAEAQEVFEQNRQWNNVMAMKYEPKLVGSSPVTNYSGSVLTSSGGSGNLLR